VTLLEVDTLRTTVRSALETFQSQTLARLRQQDGYRGVYVLTTPEGKALLMTLWDTADQAAIEGDHNFYADELGTYTTLFRAPPGRDRYEVAYAEEPARAG
jgi:hypothetical protein